MSPPLAIITFTSAPAPAFCLAFSLREARVERPEMLSTCIRTRTVLDGSRWMGRWRHRREMGSSGRVCAGAGWCPWERKPRLLHFRLDECASRCGSQVPLPTRHSNAVLASVPRCLYCFALRRKLYVRLKNHACFYLWAEERGSRLEREARAQVRGGHARGTRAG